MNEITLTINGKQVKGKAGKTVLEVCQANGIDVPTLCHLDGLSDVGACRMCVVEIEKERRPVPSCTYPARDGLVVQTNTEKLEKYRRQILELIFTEHNHFCMFCEKSGDCELQQLGYRYQMDHVRYPYTFPSLSVDSLNKYIAIDHNRCILCGRCIRACSEIAAAHTLDFSQRGWKTEVSADLNQSLGESSCLNCGSCVQACPTGAIFNKINLYKGLTDDCEQLKTVCPGCGVGCELNVLIRDNNLVRIDAPSLTGPRDTLCRTGRFELLEQTLPRITSPLVRGKKGELEECSLDSAAQRISSGMNEAKDSFAGMASSKLPSETLSLFNRFISEVIGSESVDTPDGAIYRIISEGISKFAGNGKGLDIECPIEEILKADCILVIGADPEMTNPVVSTLTRRAVSQGKAKLIVINSARDVFPLWTDLWLRPRAGSEGDLLTGLAKVLVDKGLVESGKVGTELKESLSKCEIGEVTRTTGIEKENLEQVAEMYAQAERGVIIYGNDLLENSGAGSVTTILNLASITENQVGNSLRVISLKPGANSRGAWELGLAKGIKQDRPKGLYLLLSDDTGNERLLSWLRGIDFLVVQASYHSPITAIADVVLPSPIWAEREGKYVDMDGRVLEIKQVLRPGDGVLQDKEVLMGISQKLGRELVLS